MNFKANETEQKLRGGYYTPLDLAKYISHWVVSSSLKGVFLEPSCGDGNFLEALCSTNACSSIWAHELLEREARKASQRVPRSVNLSLQTGDFLSWAFSNFNARSQFFAGVVGNPPFIRYQYMEKSTQAYAEAIFKYAGIPFTKHTNCWVPFVISSVNFLMPSGRLGMIVPAEIMHVSHSSGLRNYLLRTCSKIYIIDPKEMWFENTLQGVCILLLEKKASAQQICQGVSVKTVENREFLNTTVENLFANHAVISGKYLENKWTIALLSSEERIVFDKVLNNENVRRFRDVADVDVGIVTGANNFFLVSDEIISKYQLEHWAYPMFGRSEHCPGIIYDSTQHKKNKTLGLPCNFLWFRNMECSDNHEKMADYIKKGETEQLHMRYKCRIRNPWYEVPSVYSTAIGMLKRSHHFPKLIYNEIGAFTTDTAYRISLQKPYDKQNFVANFINSMTALSSELEGRFYGGGVLELVPSEIEKLAIITAKTKGDIAQLNVNIQRLQPEEILKIQDKLILGSIGVSDDEQAILRNAWAKLSNRRKRID